jgi:hypothetical protein
MDFIVWRKGCSRASGELIEDVDSTDLAAVAYAKKEKSEGMFVPQIVLVQALPDPVEVHLGDMK